MLIITKKKTVWLVLLLLLSGKAFAAEKTELPEKQEDSFQWLDEIQEDLSETLNESAVWMDSNFANDEEIDELAQAWARVQVGLEPKSGDWVNFPVKFRIKMRLPNLKEKVDIILSDNELDDFDRLPLESSRPTDNRSNSDDFSAAIRLTHVASNDAFFATRVGFGRGRIFTRSFYRYKKQLSEHWAIKLQPALEYWLGQGIGARQLTELSYLINRDNEVRMSHSLWHIEGFDSTKWKHGLFYLNHHDVDNAFIYGLLFKGTTNPSYQKDEVSVSFRWRQRMLRKWIFFEVEPFVDFLRENDFKEEYGIALRVEGLFGYLGNK